MPKQDPHAVVAVDDATAGVIPNEPIEHDPSKPPPEAVPVEGEAAGDEEEEEKPSVPFLELFRYADRIDKACMVVGGVAAAVGGGGMPAFSELFGRLVNNLSGKGGTIDNVEEEVSRLALYMVAVGVAEMIVGFLYVACWMVAAERQTSRMRVRFVESVLRQEPAFHDENKPGALSARLTGDVKVIRAGINDKVGLGIMNFFMFVVGYALGFWRSWKLTLVMLATLPFIAFAGALMDYLMKATAQQSRANFAQAGDVAEEVLSNVKTVQIFGQEEREVARFSSILALARWAGIKKDFFSLSGVGFANAIMFASYALAFWYAGELVKDGDEDVGQVVTVFFSVLMGSFGLGLSLPTLGGLAEARGAAFTLFHMIERPPTIDGDPDVTTTPAGKRIENFRGEVRFEHVKFAYPTRKDTQLFTDLTLTVKAGSVVAFSGASGCGKSSAIALVQRMYDPDSGAVKIDGVDLKDLDLRWWRDQVGIVSQEPNLFSGTIADNVRVGKPDATQEEVETACKQANIHDTVLTLPEQYETDIGAVGSQLSGGQKQRLAIARAIVKNPKFLILDEATSALDRKSEVEVQAALDKIVKQPGAHRTVLVIAHRLATIRNADTINFVTHDDVAGSVVAESGTYTQLMKKDGEFAHMVSKQSKTLAPPEDDDDELPVRSPLRAAKAHTKASPETPQSSKVKGNVSFGQEPGLKEEAAAEVEATEIPMLRLARMTLPQCWAVILGLIGSVVSGGLYPGFSVVFSKVLDVLASRNKQRIEDETKWYAVAFVGLGIICLLAWTAQGFYAFAGEHLTHQLRTMLLRNLLRQDATFFDTPGRDSGSLCGVLAGDCEAVHLLWGPALGYKIQMMANISVGVVIGLVYEWRVALVTMCGIPLMIIGGAVQQLAIAGFSGTEEEHPEDSIVTESLTNIRTVQAFNHDRRSRDKYALAVQQTEAGGIRTGLIAGCAYGFSQLCIYGVFALSFWYGSTLIDDGKANFNDVMIAAMSILMGAMGAGEAGGFAAKAADAGPAAKRVFALIDRAPFVDVQQQGDADLGPEGAATIEFDHVKFSYPARPDAKVLRSFSTALPAGHTVGLMGATGCGKSTLLQLLARYYDPLAGSVKVNGKDLRNVDLRTWRQALSVVPQEPALFSGSVVDNIRYGMPEATDAEVREVAKLAAVHEDIERMEQGYETDVGYKGKMLSGGQKQRVAIARGLLRKPRVMLMDEATSALDAATEAKVQDGIMAACRAHPMTVVSVAHRLTTIQHSDRIMLLDNGIVLEQGTHDELMALGGDYKARFDMFQAGTK